MKTIFIMADTVNRRMLDFYSAADPAMTPNLNRLAKRGVVFDNHWCGSAPCMPARRDVLTGRLNFLEKPWGGMEPFDASMPTILSKKNVHTQLFSDHSHYLIAGGENYTKDFTAFDVFRGQEGDPWKVKPDKTGIRAENPPEGYKGVYSESEAENRRHLKTECDYPSVKTLHSAANWLEENREADNFLLWVEAFDPHEPYDVPQHYIDLYNDEDYDGEDWLHPDYYPNRFNEKETKHLIKRYKALLTMTDRYIGELLDVLDKNNMWEDTMVIFTTDHGFHMGEHGYMAKNYMEPYNEVFHIPLIIAAPDVPHKRIDSLTQNIDILPTVMDLFGVENTYENIPYELHGKNLMPLMLGESTKVRDDIIFGYFGKQVGYTDGTHTYFRAAKDEENAPLYVYTAMPTILRQTLGCNDAVNVEDYSKIEMGNFLSWTEYPVYKFPANIVNYKNYTQEFQVRSEFNSENLMFNIVEDYEQKNPISDTTLEDAILVKLKNCLEVHDCPKEQYERLGLL